MKYELLMGLLVFFGWGGLCLLLCLIGAGIID